MASLRREELIHALPYARRYARALTASQAEGDALVADALRAMIAQDAAPGGEGLPEGHSAASEPRMVLYAAVTRCFGERPDPKPQEDGLSLQQRQLLLLTSLEDLDVPAAAWVIGLQAADGEALVAQARGRLREAAATDVMIIEDEPIIAMDIEELVRSCGHRVVGVAASEAEAVEIARRTRPGLILADINLGLGGDGAAAVSAITRELQAPVIFVTAYPERLLTGEALEPAFVITKPFEPLTLAVATYQAVKGRVELG